MNSAHTEHPQPQPEESILGARLLFEAERNLPEFELSRMRWALAQAVEHERRGDAEGASEYGAIAADHLEEANT